MYSDKHLLEFLDREESLQSIIERVRERYVRFAIERYGADVKLTAKKLRVSPQSVRMIARNLKIKVQG